MTYLAGLIRAGIGAYLRSLYGVAGGPFLLVDISLVCLLLLVSRLFWCGVTGCKSLGNPEGYYLR
ncbi:hypothetical protein imdm_2159 [gamma proteobacterium IMCC2047]|nr:hypothetical protein imdm_2159 [gamma proteobacterium IMCC2047]